MLYKIVLTEKAVSDIDEIASYIYQASASTDITQRFINSLYDRIETLEKFPKAGSNPRNRALLSEGYKFLVHEQYLVFYKVENDTVFIYSVFNSKRDYYKYYSF